MISKVRDIFQIRLPLLLLPPVPPLNNEFFIIHFILVELGIVISNVVDDPNLDSTLIVPPNFTIVSFAMYKPRPDPLEFTEAL